MKDYFNLPSIEDNVFVYFASSGDTIQIWNKPMNTSFVMFTVIGGGGGGGGGQSGSGIGRTGGSGGGTGGFTTLLLPLLILPDTLYISVGAGGDGGAPNGNGIGGRSTFVSTQPNAQAGNTIIAANGGGAGLVNGVAGAGATAYAVGNGIVTLWGIGIFNAGANGGAGGSTAGGNGSVGSGFIATGGAGGGGASSAGAAGNGGSINFNDVMPAILGGSAGGTNSGQSGIARGLFFNGTSNRAPMCFTGGAGGGAFATGVAGNGGNASYGSGGGGGGAGVTGGRGGRGGDGLVIITCF